MFSWSVSIAHLPVDGFEAAFKEACDKHFEKHPVKAFLKDAHAHQLEAATAQAKALLEVLLHPQHAPKPRNFTRDEAEANAQAKKRDKDPPHDPPELHVSISLNGQLPSGEPGDHTVLNVNVSVG